MLVLMMAMLLVDGDVFLRNDTFKNALDKAARENKLVMVDFYTDWCGPCKLMDRKTFTDTEVKKQLRERFVSIKINTEVGEGIALAERYDVKGYPCLMIMNARGKVLAKQLGYMNARDFLKWLVDNP